MVRAEWEKKIIMFLHKERKKKKETDESTSLARYCRKGKRTTKHGQPLLRHTHTHTCTFTHSLLQLRFLSLSLSLLFFFFFFFYFSFLSLIGSDLVQLPLASTYGTHRPHLQPTRDAVVVKDVTAGAPRHTALVVEVGERSGCRVP